MLNRRDFLRNIVSVGLAFGLVSPYRSALSKEPDYTEIDYDEDDSVLVNTIFCQFDNELLKTELEKCAEDIGCNIYYGQPHSPDIIAVPYFISIVDRNIVGRDSWENYVNYCDEVNDSSHGLEIYDDAPCLIVDNIKDLKIPKDKYVSQFDLNDPSAITAITYVIKARREQEVIEIKRFLGI